MIASLSLLLAASAAPATNDTITVEGSRDRDRKISRFIHELTPAPVGGQLSRFEAPVCPAVAGLLDEQEQFIADRLRKIAAAAGLRVDRADCEPNIVVIVARDKRNLIEQMAQHRPEYFPAQWGRSRIRNLLNDPSPVAAWQFEGQFWADGRSISSKNDGTEIVDLSEMQRTIEPLTRLRPSARKAFTTSVIVIQKDALSGLTTTQLADYAAMRAFVRTDPSRLRSAGADTILGIIDAPMGTPVPLTMTRWDLSFLKAFYASGKNSYANYQRSEMRRLMRRELDREEAAEQ